MMKSVDELLIHAVRGSLKTVLYYKNTRYIRIGQDYGIYRMRGTCQSWKKCNIDYIYED